MEAHTYHPPTPTQASALPTSSSNAGSNTYRLRRSVVYSLLAAALFLFAITVEGARGAYTDSPPPWYVRWWMGLDRSTGNRPSDGWPIHNTTPPLPMTGPRPP